MAEVVCDQVTYKCDSLNVYFWTNWHGNDKLWVLRFMQKIRQTCNWGRGSGFKHENSLFPL